MKPFQQKSSSKANLIYSVNPKQQQPQEQRKLTIQPQLVPLNSLITLQSSKRKIQQISALNPLRDFMNIQEISSNQPQTSLNMESQRSVQLDFPDKNSQRNNIFIIKKLVPFKNIKTQQQEVEQPFSKFIMTKSSIHSISASNIFNITTQSQLRSSTYAKLQLPDSSFSPTNPIQKQGKRPVQPCVMTQLQEMQPVNLEQQRELFFLRKFQYNPTFLYPNSDLQLQIETPHSKHLNLALKILNSCMAQYGSEEIWNETEGGKILTREETEQYFNEYIKDLGVQNLISYEFQENTVAPTSVKHQVDGTGAISKVVIGLPITYRQNRIMGVLHHEIGTHFLRKLNEKNQKWYKFRGQYNLQSYSQIEEGYAACNQLFQTALDPKKQPFLWMAALHYYAAFKASQLSFKDLFQHLQVFISDPEKRWKQCLRVKRGVTDTSRPEGMYKDQVYLRGVVKIMKHRREINFYNLHSGQLTVSDCIRLTEKSQINIEKSQFPSFLQDINLYLQALDRIAQVNFIE